MTTIWAFSAAVAMSVTSTLYSAASSAALSASRLTTATSWSAARRQQTGEQRLPDLCLADDLPRSAVCGSPFPGGRRRGGGRHGRSSHR